MMMLGPSTQTDSGEMLHFLKHSFTSEFEDGSSTLWPASLCKEKISKLTMMKAACQELSILDSMIDTLYEVLLELMHIFTGEKIIS